MKDGAQAAIAALLSECCHAPGGLYATIPMPSPLQVGITSACADRHSIVKPLSTHVHALAYDGLVAISHDISFRDNFLCKWK